MKRLLFPAAAAALVAVLLATPPGYGQTRWSSLANTSDWGTNANWDNFNVPFPLFDNEVVVGSTTSGAALNAIVDVSGTFETPFTKIAEGAGTSGDLTIGSGSSLSVVSTVNPADLTIGLDGGLGVVNVAGTLNVDGELTTPTSGDFDSSVNLSGSAAVTVGNAFLDRRLRIVGPDVSFTTTGTDAAGNGLILGGGGLHTWDFDASGPSKLNVSGNLDLGGGLLIETPGYTPAVGSRWAIAESATIDANDVGGPSGFGFVDVTGVPGRLPGTVFQVHTGAAGTTGVLTEIEVVQEPVLTVNRQTGEATLKNFSGDASTLAFDAYTVRSANGSLAASNLSGLQDGGVTPGTWYEANPQPTGLGELNASDSLALAADQVISLGAIYAPPTPTEFGANNEDLSFDYGTPDGGLFNGQVVYEGMPSDTLVLNVDPTTGAAQLLNPSAFEVDIDAYVISSDSESLSTSNWSSLDDQNADGGLWFEANASDSQLAELLTSGAITMDASQGSVVGIGTPWTIGGEQDLVFEFALEGEAFLRTGKVVYADLVTPVALPGDYNGDNLVDAIDYAVWRDANGTNTVLPNDPTPGTVTEADRAVWAGNYGASLPGGAAAVPEPATGFSVLGLALLAAIRRRA